MRGKIIPTDHLCDDPFQSVRGEQGPRGGPVPTGPDSRRNAPGAEVAKGIRGPGIRLDQVVVPAMKGHQPLQRLGYVDWIREQVRKKAFRRAAEAGKDVHRRRSPKGLQRVADGLQDER
jgi:hypothetical protein